MVNLPCLTVWILGSPFILLYLPPHLHELFEVLNIHAATDPRSSFSFCTPHAYRILVASRKIRRISCFYTIKPCLGCLTFYKTPHVQKKVKIAITFLVLHYRLLDPAVARIYWKWQMVPGLEISGCTDAWCTQKFGCAPKFLKPCNQQFQQSNRLLKLIVPKIK